MAQQPDRITAPPPGESGTSKYAPHSEGTNAFVCVDIIDLGQRLDNFPGKQPRLVHMVAMVFASGERHQDGENGKPGSLVTVQKEFTLSTFETSNLRKFVEQWYGRTFTDEQLKDGFALHKLVGRPILLTTVITPAKTGGRSYAKIMSQSPVPKGMPVAFDDVMEEYVRGDYWFKTKETYRVGAEAFTAQQNLLNALPKAAEGSALFDIDALEDEEDSLPF